MNTNVSSLRSLPRLIAAGVFFCMLISICACKKDASKKFGMPSNVEPTTQAAHHPAPVNQSIDLSQQELLAIVSKVMDLQYGAREDASMHCWPYTLRAQDADHDDVDYCMRPGGPRLVVKDADRRLSFIASNVVDVDAAQPKYTYGQVDPGLMGAFELKQDVEGAWIVDAASNAMQYGAAGDCACSEAGFVRVGRNTYGWMFESGGDWSGVVVSDHSIIVPVGSTFKDVSRIPGMTENKQDVSYDVQLDTQDPDAVMYPLLITETKNDKVMRRLVARYDARSGGYALPQK